MSRSRVLLTGSTSGIGKALSQRLAEEGADLVLLSRDPGELERQKTDLEIRWSIRVETRHFDALDRPSHGPMIDEIVGADGISGAILCHGFMAEQSEADMHRDLAERMIEVNYTSYVTLCSALATHLRKRGAGYLCALSSVAGDRGRQSNFVYGSTKGALTVYLQGLRNSLQEHGVHVLTVKPGFVDTGMTWGKLNAGSPLVASPEKVAMDIVRAIKKQKNTTYTPWFWRWIMLVICSIPESIFKRLKL